MIEKIAESIEQILIQEQKYIQNNNEAKKFNDALEDYKKMVNEGKIKPHGNRLIDIEDRFRNNIRYNTSSQKTI